MAHYLIAVHHGLNVQEQPTGNYESDEEMQQAFARVSAFNERLTTEDAFVFACGLTDPATAHTVDNRQGDPQVSNGPLPQADVFISGFWVVDAADEDATLALGAAASEACGNPVEVRRLQG